MEINRDIGIRLPNCVIHQGDCLTILRSLPDECVQCCVTSPPYFGLRDYGCEGQIGLESTPKAYVAKLVEVFREVWRIMKDDGTLWLNIGDSYAGGGLGGGESKGNSLRGSSNRSRQGFERVTIKPTGFKSKDLIGIPWMLAFALRDDGWYLRSEMIWHKPNCMPESVLDRCTKSHEQLFLLAKSDRYYYDVDALREPLSSPIHAPGNKAGTDGGHMRNDFGTDAMQRLWGSELGRNKRSVWTIPTKPSPGAHFAVMPEALVEPCILAGCPEGGTVLDPFSGEATVAVVALRHGRKFLGCELNLDYMKIAHKRIQGELDKSALFDSLPNETPVPKQEQRLLFS